MAGHCPCLRRLGELRTFEMPQEAPRLGGDDDGIPCVWMLVQQCPKQLLSVTHSLSTHNPLKRQGVHPCSKHGITEIHEFPQGHPASKQQDFKQGHLSSVPTLCRIRLCLGRCESRPDSSSGPAGSILSLSHSLPGLSFPFL